jgi:hypothetical protein
MTPVGDKVGQGETPKDGGRGFEGVAELVSEVALGVGQGQGKLIKSHGVLRRYDRVSSISLKKC